MNLISVLKKRLRGDEIGTVMFEDTSATDDLAIAGRMRALAVKLHAEGRGRLALPESVVKEIDEIGLKADMVCADDGDSGETMELYRRNARLMAACAEQARLEAVEDLPSERGRTRIEQVVSAICSEGELRMTKERLMLAIASFDDVQSLEMAEFWAMPQAVRVALSRTWLKLARMAVDIARERSAAQRWVNGEKLSLSQRGPAFFEHALRLLLDAEDAEGYANLEKILGGRGIGVDEIVRDAHRKESVLRMRLENLVANKRLIDALDWRECFDELSAVEQELNYDPSGVYSAMEDDSRAAVRSEAASLARRFRLSELTVARHTVRAAQTAAEQNAPEAQRTVCYWLYDDAGRCALAKRVGCADVVLPKIVPDPSGRMSAACIAAIFAAMLGLYLITVRDILFAMLGIPLAWGAAMALIGRVFPKIFKPAKLLKLKIDHVPDELRTLVVMPVLLSSAERAKEICDQFEALGCLESDENIRYLILGDFADADSQHMPGDEEILGCVRKRIAEMNKRAGRERFCYLHRQRQLLEIDNRWMGRDRKRGALTDLNRLLLNKPDAEDAFRMENSACDVLKKRFRYVLTLDADTRFLPGTVQRLIGTMAHPLNRARTEDGVRRGYAVLQPQMEMTASACVNGFVKLFAGSGGLNTYPSSVSGFWQDVTGTGLFGGKGLYDVAAFHGALDGALPEGKILSHDLIEGTLAGAAQVSDICFYDGFPSAMSGFLKRLNRWTRGDWQLLPELLSAKRYPSGKRLNFAERIRLLDNLLRSLWAPALLGLLTQAIWLGNGDALALGILLAYMTPVLHLFGGEREQWRRATAELAMLPATAAATVDAIVRTLWRLIFTKKHLLDWTTSADAENMKEKALPANGIAAILLIPGLFVPQWLPATLALGALFLVGSGWIEDLESERFGKELSQENAVKLRELARDTWSFFENAVDERGNFLPPDNVQIDPDVGAANRTSPTNIGLYLMSCVAARNLGFIDDGTLIRRVGDTANTLGKLEKWNGHLYNWYDIETLRPLGPEYVSSVDSGNLAAALLLCGSAMEEADAGLAAQLRSLAQSMDLAALYDPERDLFRIGLDVRHGRLSESHYDLLASESRILSFTAMMLGQVPVKHWERLARTAAATEKGGSLVSWSGTMFEYLMPEIFMHAPENTLLGGAMRNAILAQKALGEKKKRPWGVSESGYYAFDMQLNYQYRAFGLGELSLSGQAQQDVVAPYACMLAAFADPRAAVMNLSEMERLGWRGRFGMYEAADYLRAQNGEPKLVKSYMAHHQGMALCAVCNVLTDRSLSRAFQRIPEARALELLLEEREPTCGKLRRRSVREHVCGQTAVPGSDGRVAGPDRRLADTHLLGGAGATVLVTADGAVHYQRYDQMATRFAGDFLNRSDGACVHILCERSGESAVLAGNTVFFPGSATVRCDAGAIRCEMKLCVSPEDGTLFKQIEIENTSEKVETVRVADCVPAALGTRAEMLSHPVFRHLFVQSERVARHAVLLRRRPREADENPPVLVHMLNAPGEIECETDFGRLVGRMGSTMRPGGISWDWSGSSEAPLNPCSAIRTRITLAPDQKETLHFAMALVWPEDAKGWFERNYPESIPERALQLAGMQARSMLGFIGMEQQQFHRLQRCAALLFDGRLGHSEAPMRREEEISKRETLWELGVSGDLPVICVRVSECGQMKTVRDAIRAHELYRSMGLKVDLIFVDEGGCSYDKPVRDMVSDAVAFSHLGELRSVAGGVHLLDGTRLTDAQRTALARFAALDVDASQDFYKTLRRALTVLDVPVRKTTKLNPGKNRLAPLRSKNGFGEFLADGRYAIDVLPDKVPPAPWSNLMANDDFGVLLTERGGGFVWMGSSRSGRLTAFSNDVLSEGWGWMLYLVNEESGEFMRLLPGSRPEIPFRTVYSPTETVYSFDAERLSGTVSVCVRTDAPEMRIQIALRSAEKGRFRLVGFVDWLMGEDARDAARLRTWSRDGACFAVGAMNGVGYFAAASARVQPGCNRNIFLGRGTVQNPEGIAQWAQRGGGWTLSVPVELQADGWQRSQWVIGAAQERQQAYARVRSFYAQPDYDAVRAQAQEDWEQRIGSLAIETPDEALNRMANGWLLHQVLASRVRGRTGLYQPGGAYGFRDQLQDMLALLPSDPRRVREHILRCAAHQFEDGDVMHWWHEPYLGVRTRISDDMLFLPYIAAKYVEWTQDAEVLDEQIAYLQNVGIEEGKEDRFCEMQPGSVRESLHRHCMRAFRRAARTGSHGLVLMGCGDWNDGMNRVGDKGMGESVWLSQFFCACAAEYAEICTNEEDRNWLLAQAELVKAAVEQYGWDGEWYLRAYTDEGVPLGSSECRECRIDAISQAWAVLAGLDDIRCMQAMDAAWKMLADENLGIIRLLTPPFDGEYDPGYIRGYPKGVRENGAQYTHAACWLLLALIRMGDEERAHRALRMLLPCNHSDTEDKAMRYRVEPYVVAADICDGLHAGRGGWTWYTGSASWLYQCILALIGFERRGNRVRMCALLGDWPEVSATVRFGRAKYRLISRKNADQIVLDGKKHELDWIEMTDDGLYHEAVFPARTMNR